MGRRNWTSRFLDGIQWVEFYNTETELLFNFCEHPLSKNTSLQPPGLPTKDLHRGTQKGPFLNHSGKSELRLTKASARREGTGVLGALDLVCWDRHGDLYATGQDSSPRIPLHLYTQKLLSESKLTKQEHFWFLHGLLRSMCSHLKPCPVCHLPAFRVICILWFAKRQPPRLPLVTSSL